MTTNSALIPMKCIDNSTVHIASIYVGVEPILGVKR